MAQATSNKAALYAPDLPWNKFKAEDLGPCIMQYVYEHEPFFRRWAEIWFENFQFVYGNHSVKWSRKYGFAVNHDFLRRDSAQNMRANTNLARVITEALTSFIFGNIPEWETETMDRASTKGKRFQKIVQKLLEAYMVRLLMEKEGRNAAQVFVLYGQMGMEIDWNSMAGQLLEIPRFVKRSVPVYSTYMAPNFATGGLLEVPSQLKNERGEPIMEQRWEAELDRMGRQIIDKMFAGDVSINVLTPLEYRRELGKSGMHKTRWVQRFKLLDYDEFLDYYKNIGGQTPEFNKIRPVYSDPSIYNLAIRHYMRLQFTAPPVLDDSFGRQQNIFKSSLFKHKVFVVEHYDKPHPEKWPQGRRVVVANGTCTHITAPNYSTNKLDGWHPFTEAQWMSIPPSSIATGPVNDVVRKNREVNVKDSLVATAVRRNMGSKLLIKNGTGLDPQQITGEPGESHVVSDPYAVRWLHDEQPIPPVIARLRELDKEDIYESSGALDALRGEPSSGASSGYQEKQREEREEKRLSPARKEFEAAFSGAGEKLIACLKANVIKLDDSVIGFLKRSGAGEFTIDDVIAFLKTPIDYGVDIRVKKSSMAIRSRATHQANLQELAGGVLNQRLTTDAEVLDEYLKEFDVETLRDASAPHRDRATRENEIFLDMLRLGPDTEGITQPLVFFGDDDDIHMAKHQSFLVQNFDEFRNNELLLTQFLEHQERHRLQKEEKLAKLMPGTSTQTATMMAQAKQAALPTVQTIYMDSQARKAQQVEMKGAAEESQAPQSPRQPSGPEGGSGKIDPNAPSQNTPTAASKGGLE